MSLLLLYQQNLQNTTNYVAAVQKKDVVAAVGVETFANTTAVALAQKPSTVLITETETFIISATNLTQHKDSTSITGAESFTAPTVVLLQKKSTISAPTVESFNFGSTALAQKKDTVAIDGFYGYRVLTANLAQKKDSFASIALERFDAGSTAVTQAKDSFAAITFESFPAAASITQKKDAFSASASNRYIITSALIQAKDRFSATDVETFFGTAPIVQRNDVSNIIAQGLIIGSIATEQDPDQADIEGFNSKVGPVNISVFLAQEQAIRSAQVFSNGWIDYFDGPIPDLTESPPYGSTLLASGRLPAPFARTVIDGVVTSYVFPLAYIFANGEAQWFRLYTEDHQTPLMDGLIGPGLGLTTTTFVAGETVEVDEFVFTIPGK